MGYYDSRDPDRDIPTEFVYEVGTNKVTLKQHDPHGFWKFQFSKGLPPEWMRGTYTAYIYAKKDLEKYMKSKQKVELDETRQVQAK